MKSLTHGISLVGSQQICACLLRREGDCPRRRPREHVYREAQERVQQICLQLADIPAGIRWYGHSLLVSFGWSAEGYFFSCANDGLRYVDVWKGLVSNAIYVTGDPGQDFGNGAYSMIPPLSLIYPTNKCPRRPPLPLRLPRARRCGPRIPRPVIPDATDASLRQHARPRLLQPRRRLELSLHALLRLVPRTLMGQGALSLRGRQGRREQLGRLHGDLRRQALGQRQRPARPGQSGRRRSGRHQAVPAELLFDGGRQPEPAAELYRE